ncbi:MAG: MarR family winged helix-turn-helix transcriptional regulator [Acidovorax sp.]|jgi:DNA-binding MarR family transcriptional regulator
MTSTPQPSSPDVSFYGHGHSPAEESVGYLMRKVMSSIRTQADAQLSTHDLTFAQWLPLFKISKCQAAATGQVAATVAVMARELETDAASMTRTLDRLEAKGLVLRERSTTDRRVVHVVLTPEGEKVAAKVPPVLAEVLNNHLRGFTRDEWQLLLSMLRRMLANGDAVRQEQQEQPAA